MTLLFLLYLYSIDVVADRSRNEVVVVIRGTLSLEDCITDVVCGAVEVRFAVVCIVLYCIVLYCIVLYCIVLYCIVLCWWLYCVALYCIVLYCVGGCTYGCNCVLDGNVYLLHFIVSS